MAQRLAHKLLALGGRHPRLEVRVAEAIDVGRARAANRVRPLEERAADGDGVDLAALDLVPAGDEDARGEHVLVVVAQLAEEVGRRLHLGRLAVLHLVRVEEVGHIVGDRLRVGGRAGAADVDALVDRGHLVGRAVRDVHAGRGPAVGADHDAAVVRDGHDGGAEVDGLLEEIEVALRVDADGRVLLLRAGGGRGVHHVVRVH